MKNYLTYIVVFYTSFTMLVIAHNPSGSIPHRIKLDIGGVPQDLDLQLSVNPWKVDIPPLTITPLALNQDSIIDCVLGTSCLIGLYLYSQSLLTLSRNGRVFLSICSMLGGAGLSYFSLQELLKRNKLQLHCSWNGVSITKLEITPKYNTKP